MGTTFGYQLRSMRRAPSGLPRQAPVSHAAIDVTTASIRSRVHDGRDAPPAESTHGSSPCRAAAMRRSCSCPARGARTHPARAHGRRAALGPHRSARRRRAGRRHGLRVRRRPGSKNPTHAWQRTTVVDHRRGTRTSGPRRTRQAPSSRCSLPRARLRSKTALASRLKPRSRMRRRRSAAWSAAWLTRRCAAWRS